MFDRRVVRGSTYAQQPLPVSAHSITHTSALPNKDIAKTIYFTYVLALVVEEHITAVGLQFSCCCRDLEKLGVSQVIKKFLTFRAAGHFKSSPLCPVLILVHENPFHIHPIDLLNSLYLMPLMPNAGLEN
jgi:hypothetical protein